MPQETNLNVSPYFDDFDPKDQYYKVLFKPGYPVQARELTSLQSILQNQIEQFGSHIFKEGSVVIPGNIIYRNDLNSVILENFYQGRPSDLYFDYLVGTKIKGQKSGITASIESYIKAGDGVSQPTLFVKYLNSDSQNSSESTFLNGENLLVIDDVSVTDPDTLEEDQPSEIVIKSGEAFASTISSQSTFLGSSVYLEEGIYFIRGYFVEVPTSVLYLDPYSNKPSAKVGLRVTEDVVTSYEDNNLYDNAQGFSNFSAPGADRLSIIATLDKVPLDFKETNNFIQLLEIQNGKLINITNTTEYNIISQEFARRTYDESGDYYVNAPIISVAESLNNYKGNDGLFNENQLTYNENVPNENLGTYIISPLKAYVKGYEVETVSPTFLDFSKPRDEKTLKNQSINYYTGPTFTLNRVHGSPVVSIATTYYVSLRDSRVGSSSVVASGNEIGLARVYDFALESGSYNTNNLVENQWDISLYDIQAYTVLTVNEPITLNTPTYIKGKETGAVGFLRYNVSNSSTLTVYNTKGKFSIGERLIFDGIENTRITKTVKTYGVNDVKSIYGSVGTAYTFTADVVQSTLNPIGQVRITGESSGISTVTSSNVLFVGIATVGNLVAFSNPGLSTNTFAKIESVTPNSITISGVTTVTGICDGALPTNTINPSDFRILTSNLQQSEDNSLFTILPKSYVSNVDLTQSSLTIRKQYDIVISSNSVTVNSGSADETFLPFDEERYVLIREDGTTEPLSSDKFTFTYGSQTLTLNGLSGNGSAKLLATLRKVNVKSKIKNRNKVKTIIVDKSKYVASGVGATTLNDGLKYGKYSYGLRVQDEEICLLEPDVTRVYGVFESNDVNDPDIPSIILTSLDGPTNKTGDLLIGEEFIGEQSQSIGIYAEKINDLKIGFNYLNSNTFIPGEKIKFKESGITAFISLLDQGDKNISSSFIFDCNQKETIYDYSKINRLKDTKEPTRKLKIVFESSSFLSSDTGDLTTVNSYEQFNYCDIKNVYDTLRNSDIIDIRPRVSSIDTVVETARSPFEFLGRNFTSTGNSSSNILASDESILLTYSFYLPRIDKIVLNKNGLFELKLGVSSEDPQPPVVNEDTLEIANINLNPYLCNINDVVVDIKQHKRYKMSDIGKLEDRIQNLESYTSLSLLEVNTSNFSVTDENGLNRFKSGFFVDNFSTVKNQDKSTIIKNSIDTQNLELRPTHYTTSIDLLLGTNSLLDIGNNANSQIDMKFDTDLIGIGVTRTGQLVTLNYEEVPIINQPYASRVVSVSPYSDDFYSGTIQIFPSSDVWVDQSRLDPNYIEIDNQTFDNQTGYNPLTWGSSFAESLGDNIVNIQAIPYMRSRNVEFICKRLKPFTRVYSFFGGVDVNKYTIPKLLEISMNTGVFQVGETVIGSFDIPGSSSPVIKFRVAKQNHKYGSYNSPSDVYIKSPYNLNNTISDVYSSTSTILNVDTYSLSNQVQGEFNGYISVGMKLRGQTSKAEATLTNLRLVTDENGVVIGSFFIPDGTVDVNPKFECGTKVFRITSNNNNSLIFGTYSTASEEKFVSEGKINVVQENVIVTRPVRIDMPADEPYIPGPGNPSTYIPVVVDPPEPRPVTTNTPTNVYTNFGARYFGAGATNRTIQLLRAAGAPNSLINSIKPGISANKITLANNFINASSYAANLNIRVLSNNVRNPTRTTVGTGQQVGVVGSTSRVGPGPKATNKNSGTGSASAAAPRSAAPSSSNSSGVRSAPAPAPGKSGKK